MSRYIPMPAYYDNMPVDISFVFEDEKPAGKHGFLKVDGEDFRFEDGTLAKFYGVNINGGACFPDHDYAEKFAMRLAMTGCNIVRLHQMDAEWGVPNLFSFTRGKRITNTRSFDERSLERLDYLVKCLKEQGIYLYLDMMTYRKFKSGDGVVDAELLPDLAKPWCMTNAHLIELQKEYATNLWTHYNPYTGLCYKDDPAFVMTEIIAECDLFMDRHSGNRFSKPSQYYITEYRHMFRDWLAERKIEYDWENCDLYAREETLIRFKMDVTNDYLGQMYDHLRSIGVKCPITGTNWHSIGHHVAMCHQKMDFTDEHPYYGPGIDWTNSERIMKNKGIAESNGILHEYAASAIAGKPFYLSEWDMLWPNTYRAEGPIYFAAMAALQGWCGLSVHTYSYSTRLNEMKVLGRELSSPVSGIAYREGIYATWNDPAQFGLFYHGALITRRGDVSKANKGYAVLPGDFVKHSYKAFSSLFERSRVRMCFDGKLPEGYNATIMDHQQLTWPEPNRFVSDTRQVWRDKSKQIGAVDTQRTKVLYGKLGRGFNCGSTGHYSRPVLAINGLEIRCATDFGVIALSSLTNAPIEASDNILLSAIGRARNTDAVFDGDKMIDVGKPPILAEVIDAEIRLKNIHGTKLKVWGINAEGFYAGQIPTEYDGEGYLHFRIGDENNPACYYLLVKE